MDSFDCFCAICGTSIVRVEIGSAEEQALARRRARVAELRVRKLRGEDISRDVVIRRVLRHDEPPEERSYDPDLVSEESVEWLDDSLHCLGFNTRAPGTSKAFVSGQVLYHDHVSPLPPPLPGRLSRCSCGCTPCRATSIC